MADLGAIVAQLKTERAKLDKAIEALTGFAGKSDGGHGTRTTPVRAELIFMNLATTPASLESAVEGDHAYSRA